MSADDFSAAQEQSALAARMELDLLSGTQKKLHLATYKDEPIHVEFSGQASKTYPTALAQAYLMSTAQSASDGEYSTTFTYRTPVYEFDEEKPRYNFDYLRKVTLEIPIGRFSVAANLRNRFRISLVKNAAHVYANIVTLKYGESGTPLSFNLHAMNVHMQKGMNAAQRELHSKMIGNVPDCVNWSHVIPAGRITLPMTFLHYTDEPRMAVPLFKCGAAPPIHMVMAKRDIKDFIQVQFREDVDSDIDDPKSWRRIPFTYDILEKRGGDVNNVNYIDQGRTPRLLGYYKVALPEQISSDKKAVDKMIATRIVAESSPSSIELGKSHTITSIGRDYVAVNIHYMAVCDDARELGLASHYGTYWKDDPHSNSYNPFCELIVSYGEVAKLKLDRFQIEECDNLAGAVDGSFRGIPDEVGYNCVRFTDSQRAHGVPYAAPMPPLNATVTFRLGDTDPHSRHSSGQLEIPDLASDEPASAEDIVGRVLKKAMSAGASKAKVVLPSYVIHSLIYSYVVITFEYGKDVRVETHFSPSGKSGVAAAIAAGAAS